MTSCSNISDIENSIPGWTKAELDYLAAFFEGKKVTKAACQAAAQSGKLHQDRTWTSVKSAVNRGLKQTE